MKYNFHKKSNLCELDDIRKTTYKIHFLIHKTSYMIIMLYITLIMNEIRIK